MAVANGEAEKTKMVGESQASAIAAVGSAEAEGMRLKANSYKEYKEAALIDILLRHLPQV